MPKPKRPKCVINNILIYNTQEAKCAICFEYISFKWGYSCIPNKFKAHTLICKKCYSEIKNYKYAKKTNTTIHKSS